MKDSTVQALKEIAGMTGATAEGNYNWAEISEMDAEAPFMKAARYHGLVYNISARNFHVKQPGEEYTAFDRGVTNPLSGETVAGLLRRKDEEALLQIGTADGLTFKDLFSNEEAPAYERAATRRVLDAATERQRDTSRHLATRAAESGPPFTEGWANTHNPLSDIQEDGSA